MSLHIKYCSSICTMRTDSGGGVSHHQGVSAAGCAAITASPALRKLSCCGLGLQFPMQRRMMQLTALTLTEWDVQSSNEKELEVVDLNSKVQRLVQCCPAVQVLQLGGRCGLVAA